MVPNYDRQMPPGSSRQQPDGFWIRSERLLDTPDRNFLRFDFLNAVDPLATAVRGTRPQRRRYRAAG
jgi:hypothetical protein